MKKQIKLLLRVVSLVFATLLLALVPAVATYAAVLDDPVDASSGTLAAIAVGTAIAGLLTPFVSAVVNSPRWTSQQRSMLATGIGLVFGILAIAVTGGFALLPWYEWGANILAVVGVSQTLYSFILKTPVEAINNAVRGPE